MARCMRDSQDSRMQQVWYANGKLWGALDTALTLDRNRAGIEYFIVNPGGADVAIGRRASASSHRRAQAASRLRGAPYSSPGEDHPGPRRLCARREREAGRDRRRLVDDERAGAVRVLRRGALPDPMG